jgi:Family of unknown function (DUF6174)
VDRRRTAGALLTAGLLTGCGDGSGPSASGPLLAAPATTSAAVGWDEPPAYRFAVTSSCGERAFIGDYRVTVRNGQVVGADHLSFDGEAWQPVQRGEWEVIPTLGAMLEEAAGASGKPEVGEVLVRTDPADGHPVEVRVDHRSDAIDDESCYVVTDYRPGG